MTQLATVRMRVNLMALNEDGKSGKAKVTNAILEKLDKELDNKKSKAWEIINNIWFPNYFGDIVKREHTGKFMVEIVTSLDPEHYEGVFASNYKPHTIKNMEKEIKDYINDSGPDTWMEGNIIWEKDYELVPVLSYVKIKQVEPSKSGKGQRKSRKAKRKSRRKSRKAKRKSRRKSRKAKRKSRRKSRKAKRKSRRKSRKAKSGKVMKVQKAPRGCVKQTTAKYTNRPSPPYPANECCGRLMEGNDGRVYRSNPNRNGVCAWKIEA